MVSFFLNDPENLQNKVFFEVMLYFCRRGRQNLRQLKKMDFSFNTDGTGARYVYKTTDELTKNRREDDEGFDGGVMYEKPGPNCQAVPKSPKSLKRVFISAPKEKRLHF